MKAIKFKECNHKFAEKQDQYHTLPGHLDFKGEGQFTFCLKLNLWERAVLLFTGKFWCSLLTFGRELQPNRFSVRKGDLIKKPKLKKVPIEVIG